MNGIVLEQNASSGGTYRATVCQTALVLTIVILGIYLSVQRNAVGDLELYGFNSTLPIHGGDSDNFIGGNAQAGVVYSWNATISRSLLDVTVADDDQNQHEAQLHRQVCSQQAASFFFVLVFPLVALACCPGTPMVAVVSTCCKWANYRAFRERGVGFSAQYWVAILLTILSGAAAASGDALFLFDTNIRNGSFVSNTVAASGLLLEPVRLLFTELVRCYIRTARSEQSKEQTVAIYSIVLWCLGALSFCLSVAAVTLIVLQLDDEVPVLNWRVLLIIPLSADVPSMFLMPGVNDGHHVTVVSCLSRHSSHRSSERHGGTNARASRNESSNSTHVARTTAAIEGAAPSAHFSTPASGSDPASRPSGSDPASRPSGSDPASPPPVLVAPAKGSEFIERGMYSIQRLEHEVMELPNAVANGVRMTVYLVTAVIYFLAWWHDGIYIARGRPTGCKVGTTLQFAFSDAFWNKNPLEVPFVGVLVGIAASIMFVGCSRQLLPFGTQCKHDPLGSSDSRLCPSCGGWYLQGALPLALVASAVLELAWLDQEGGFDGQSEQANKVRAILLVPSRDTTLDPFYPFAGKRFRSGGTLLGQIACLLILANEAVLIMTLLVRPGLDLGATPKTQLRARVPWYNFVMARQFLIGSMYDPTEVDVHGGYSSIRSRGEPTEGGSRFASGGSRKRFAAVGIDHGGRDRSAESSSTTPLLAENRQSASSHGSLNGDITVADEKASSAAPGGASSASQRVERVSNSSGDQRGIARIRASPSALSGSRPPAPFSNQSCSRLYLYICCIANESRPEVEQQVLSILRMAKAYRRAAVHDKFRGDLRAKNDAAGDCRWLRNTCHEVHIVIDNGLRWVTRDAPPTSIGGGVGAEPGLERQHRVYCEQYNMLVELMRQHVKDSEVWEEGVNHGFELSLEPLLETLTPYGYLNSFSLMQPGKGGWHRFNLHVHLKDIQGLCQRGKRHNHIIVLSHILSLQARPDLPRGCTAFDNLQHPDVDDNYTFLLSLDADTRWDSVGVRRLSFDLEQKAELSGVCGRVIPQITGSGTSVVHRLQSFEYLSAHTLSKSLEEVVLGNVTCLPGCYTLWRLSHIRRVFARYCKAVENVKDHFSLGMGEDRFLCTLILAAGGRLAYNPNSISITICPEKLQELIAQRQRWDMSTEVNFDFTYTNTVFLRRISLPIQQYSCYNVVAAKTSPHTTVVLLVIMMDAAIQSVFHARQGWGAGVQVAMLLFYLLMILHHDMQRTDLRANPTETPKGVIERIQDNLSWVGRSWNTFIGCCCRGCLPSSAGYDASDSVHTRQRETLASGGAAGASVAGGDPADDRGKSGQPSRPAGELDAPSAAKGLIKKIKYIEKQNDMDQKLKALYKEYNQLEYQYIAIAGMINATVLLLTLFVIVADFLRVRDLQSDIQLAFLGLIALTTQAMLLLTGELYSQFVSSICFLGSISIFFLYMKLHAISAQDTASWGTRIVETLAQRAAGGPTPIDDDEARKILFFVRWVRQPRKRPEIEDGAPSSNPQEGQGASATAAGQSSSPQEGQGASATAAGQSSSPQEGQGASATAAGQSSSPQEGQGASATAAGQSSSPQEGQGASATAAGQSRGTSQSAAPSPTNEPRDRSAVVDASCTGQIQVHDRDALYNWLSKSKNPYFAPQLPGDHGRAFIHEVALSVLMPIAARPTLPPVRALKVDGTGLGEVQDPPATEWRHGLVGEGLFKASAQHDFEERCFTLLEDLKADKPSQIGWSLFISLAFIFGNAVAYVMLEPYTGGVNVVAAVLVGSITVVVVLSFAAFLFREVQAHIELSIEERSRVGFVEGPPKKK